VFGELDQSRRSLADDRRVRCGVEAALVRYNAGDSVSVPVVPIGYGCERIQEPLIDSSDARNG